HDLIVGRVPGPALRWVAAEAVRVGKPIAMLVCGIVETGGLISMDEGLIRRAVRRALVNVVVRQQQWTARRAVFVGVWDPPSLSRYQGLCRTVAVCQSPNLTSDMFTRRDDTCMRRPIRLLRICDVLPLKDIESLLEAMARLRTDGLE